MTQILRPYQSAALEGLRDGMRREVQRQILVSPTGSGKTTIAAAMVHGAVAKGKRVLFLAHRKELIDQCSERLDGCQVRHGVIMAGHRRHQPLAPVQIASIATLVRRDKPRADLIIVDECHHARSASYEKILQCYPGVPVIGLSATPWRIDGKGLGALFQEIVVAATPRQLIEEGHLVRFTGFAFDHPDLAKVKKTGSDYDSHGLELVMGSRPITGSILGQWQRHARGLRTVIFACTVAHSRELVGRFAAAGIPAEHVDGETPPTERAAILHRLKTGRTLVVSNVSVLTEGWDCPAVEVCVLARPTLSTGLYLQMVGRVLRPAPGKSVARIHDHAGLLEMHGLPDQDRDYSLSADMRIGRKGAKVPALSTCPTCFGIYEGPRSECPICGAVPVRKEREIRELDDGAVIATPIEQMVKRLPRIEASEASQRATFERFRAEGLQKGHKPAAAACRFKAIFGHWPPKQWNEVAA